ncbi:MAG TPA: nucleic acid-binding protein [Nitrospiraceae bacterium]|nr:nucleic acid-binding protein [Nitrospiraceae bacterium]
MTKYPKEERIPPSLSSSQAIELIKKQMEQIDKLLQLHCDDPEVRKWDNLTEQVIIRAFGKPHDNLDVYSSAYDVPSISSWTGNSNGIHQNSFIKTLHNKRSLLEGFIEQLKIFGSTEKSQDLSIIPKSFSKKVFIVHGHNEQAKTELALILTRLGFEPIILHEQPSQGMTIIEKLEKHSDVGFAFILLTPDDKGCKEGQEDNLRPRARQNVVFEFGLFAGKLGRNRVCCLYTGDIEPPSDLHGLIYLPFKNSVNESQLDIVKELRAAGYEVKI